MTIKRIRFILTLMTLTLIIVGCSASTIKDAASFDQSTYDSTVLQDALTLTVNEENITKDVTNLTFTYKNDSDKEYFYGAEPHLEIKLGDTWYVVPPLEGISWIEIAYLLAPHSSTEETVDIKTIYGPLEAGDYRWVKNLYTENETITLFAEFKIND